MRRKTRRSKTSEDGEPERSRGSEKQAAKAPPGEAAKAPAGGAAKARPKPRRRKAKAEPEPTAEPADKISLPAFGFATDLLKKPQGSGSEPEASEPEGTKPEIDPGDPSRIFAFADSLERGTAETEAQAAPVKLETWVAFSLAGEIFALPVTPVREVVRVASITRVPHAPKPIRGVTNMRGRVIPVIDLRLRIELPQAELGRASRVIVVSSRGRLLGLLVDGVHQVIHIDMHRIQPPPEDVMTVQSDYLRGVYHLEDQLILLLDIDRALIIHEAASPAAGTAPGDTTPGSATEERPQA